VAVIADNGSDSAGGMTVQQVPTTPDGKTQRKPPKD